MARTIFKHDFNNLPIWSHIQISVVIGMFAFYGNTVTSEMFIAIIKGTGPCKQDRISIFTPQMSPQTP